MQFVLRILGWVNIHAGRLVEETNVQDENSTATAPLIPEVQTDTALYTPPYKHSGYRKQRSPIPPFAKEQDPPLRWYRFGHPRYSNLHGFLWFFR